MYSKKVIHWLKFIEARRKKEKEGMGDYRKGPHRIPRKTLGSEGRKMRDKRNMISKMLITFKY